MNIKCQILPHKVKYKKIVFKIWCFACCLLGLCS